MCGVERGWAGMLYGVLDFHDLFDIALALFYLTNG